MANIANLLVDQGTDFETTISYTDDAGSPKDLTNYSARSQMRKSYYSTNAAATFETTINAANGEVTLSLTSATTSNVKSGRYLYDVELVENTTSKVTRLVEGIVTVMPEVTK